MAIIWGKTMNDALNKSKDIINKQVIFGAPYVLENTYNKYQKIQASTNENIDGYMSQLDFNGKYDALSVMGSGDHPLNISFYGIQDIDTFDINALTEYYALGIKRSAILALNYNDYIIFMNKLFDRNTSINEINDLINLIIPYMDFKHKDYWKNLMDYNYKLQKNCNTSINIFHMLLLDIEKIEGVMKNLYLKSEENYNKLRSNLGKANITFMECECLDLGNKLTKQYDFIFLSNIADYMYKYFGNYWNYSKLVEFEDLFMRFLKKDGILVLDYIYNCYFKTINQYTETLIRSSNISKNDLTKEQIITFSHIFNNKIEYNCESGLLLVKKH